jgi:hypothetical protein
MNEAEFRAELIDPAQKAAGWGVVEASRIRRTITTLGRRQCASKPPSRHGQSIPPSSQIHRVAINGYPTRNIPCLIEDVGYHLRRPGLPGEPVAMQLDPPESISRQVRIQPRMGQPGTPIGHHHCQRRVVCLNQPSGGVGPRGPVWRGVKIASDHAQILCPRGVRDQDGQRRSRRLRVRPTIAGRRRTGAGTGLLKRLQHTPRLMLRGGGIANPSSRNVAHAGIQNLGQCPRCRPASLLVHASGHPRHLVSARYHIQGPVRNDCFVRQSNQRLASPASLDIA